MRPLSQLKKWLVSTRQRTNVLVVYAPVSGEMVNLATVPDRVFSEKIVGDGIAIRPAGDTMAAPITGTIGKIFATHHAFSIATDSANGGIELFVHFGIDTFELSGRGFQCMATNGQRVKKGDPIIKFDLDWLQQAAKSTLTPVLVANMDACKRLVILPAGQVTLATTPIMHIEW